MTLNDDIQSDAPQSASVRFGQIGIHPVRQTLERSDDCA
jgi:hypothetical protein